MELSSQAKVETGPKTEERLELPRVLLGGGFGIVLLAVGIGAALKEGQSPWPGYIALAGVVVIGVGIILMIVEKVTGKPIGRSNQQAG